MKLTFHLAGINNQNFLMRDEETGTFWQQISGAAISGPLKGRNLVLVSSDELTFELWKSEQPNGTLVIDIAEFTPEYAKKDWDVQMQEEPTVLSYAQPGLTPRTLILGVRAFRANMPGSVIESEFYRMRDKGALMMDDATGNRWNFQGCAVEGKAKGVCLDRLDIIKDYWFDWRRCNSGTSVGPSPKAQGQ